MGFNLLVALMIFAARVLDVSLGTFRQAMIIRGKRLYAFMLAFVESLIWVYAVSRVLQEISDPFTALAFAAGFATGTYVGITIERFFKIGDQIVRVFSVRGDEIAGILRENGFRVTVIDGRGRNGVVNILFVQVRRKQSGRILKVAREVDPGCYVVVDDISEATYGGLLPVRK